MSTITFREEHYGDFTDLLSKASAVANIALTPGLWKSSSQAKFIGLPSIVSQAILNEYNQFRNIQTVIRAPLIVPGKAVKYEDNVFRIKCLDNLVILNPCPYEISKVYRIVLDAEYAYVSLCIDTPPWQEIDQRSDVCTYDSPFKLEDVILRIKSGNLYDEVPEWRT